MNKGKSTWKYNKLLSGRRNYFDGLSGTSHILRLDSLIPTINSVLGIGDIDKSKVGLTNLPYQLADENSRPVNIFKNPYVNAGINAGSSLIGGALSGGFKTTAGDIMNGVSNVASMIPGWGTLASGALKVGAGLTNRAFGVKWNNEHISNVENNIRSLNNFQSNAGDWDTLASNWSNAAAGMDFKNSYLGKAGWLAGNKLRNKANDYRDQIDSGELWVLNTLTNNATSISKQQMNNMLANNINAYGGELHTQGGNFTNGIVNINNGGNHESNPNEGVLIGVDPQGIPNLVEEGENIFNDYVFSKRLTVPNSVRNKYKLRGTKNVSFAEASKKLSKESEERPNDPISKNGLEAIMNDLSQALELVKAKEQAITAPVNYAAYGGRVNKFYEGGDSNSVIIPYARLPLDPAFLEYIEDNNQDDGPLYIIPDYVDISPGAITRDLLFLNGIRLNSVNTGNFLDNVLESYNNNTSNNKPTSNNRSNASNTALSKPVTQSVSNNTAQSAPQRSVSNSGSETNNRSGRVKVSVSSTTRNPSTVQTTSEEQELPWKYEHMLINEDGTLTPMPESDIYTGNVNFSTGLTWADGPGKKYIMLNYGNYAEDPNSHTRRYFYKLRETPTEEDPAVNNFYMYNPKTNLYDLVEGDDPFNKIMNSGYELVNSIENKTGGKDFYYKAPKKYGDVEELPTDARYAPIIGLAGSVITDALGITNKPDYSEASALLNAAKLAGLYQPVRYNPIGNYLTYRPFDRDYYLNKMNAAQNAAIRNVMNTSGGNRATTQAGIMALNNNYLNKVGDLAVQGDQYNMTNKNNVATFNRDTDKFNVANALGAAEANQKALAEATRAYYSGAASAAEIRQKERLAADAAKSANLSGLFTSIGDIGRENMAWNWRNYGLNTETWGNAGTNPYANLLGNVRIAQANTEAKGGKIKRKKKGLTI